MRHFKAGNRLSRNSGWREATVRDIARATLIHQRVQTTKARAKEARKLIDRMITLGKKDTLPAKRKAFSILCDHHLVSSLFTKIAPRFKDRKGGYTRIIPLALNRRGDNASVVLLELTERYLEEKKPVKAVAEGKVTAVEGKMKPKDEIKSQDKKQEKESQKEPMIKSESRPVTHDEKHVPIKDKIKPSPKKIVSSFKKMFRKSPSEG